MKNIKLITIHENMLKKAREKQAAAYRAGNFTAVNKLTKEIVSIQMRLERLREE